MKYLILLLIFFIAKVYSQNNGIIIGKVTDKETQSSVHNATVSVLNTDMKTVTDNDGKFQFKNIPLGNYELKVTCVGYEAFIRTDIVVNSSRPAEVEIELLNSNITTSVIDVEGKYFQKSTDVSTSSYSLDFEEVRRAPGAIEDVSRMLQIMPGVSSANDGRNDLIVRGGSPSENLTIIDGIEIPNINHFPTEGSTSGPIGMINVKFIDNVKFSTGGFSARYGDKLSSIMDIRFREGYRKKFLSDINLSTAGFGGIFEGPLFSQKGSFIISARKSYLNLIKGAIRLAAVPDYWDFNLKADYDFNNNTKLSLIGIGGLDKISFINDSKEISDENPYGKVIGDQQQFTVGLNLKKLFKKGYWQMIAANSTGFAYYTNNDIRTDELKFRYKNFQTDFNFKTEFFYQLNNSNNIIAGVSGHLIRYRNETFYKADTTNFGDPMPESNVNTADKYNKASVFVQYTYKIPDNKVILNAGARFDYFSGIKEKTAVSPRFGISYSLFNSTTLSASTGIYYQSPEYLWLSSEPGNNELKFIKAIHYVAGIEHLFTPELRMQIEAYYKEYKNYPVSTVIPTYVLISGGTENGPNLMYGKAVSAGFGFSRGIDFSLHKKLTGNGIYGMINYSLSESKVTALVGGEKPGSFDYRHSLTIIAGYQISNDWLIGIKFRYTTGRPYTPFDIVTSTYYGRGVSDFNNFNSARFKDYNRLDFRVDKKWNFKKLSIVTYIELQNALNTNNVYSYFWNEYKNEQGTIYQWKFLPVGGFSIQF
ncbi:MAG: TonB-dependent receptor [Ignavibacteria bacterium]|nr:TonB-dependent receptor [Ignavibacteria bacterium]